MPIPIISVCVDQQLQETLEAVAQSNQLGPVTQISSYISRTDSIKLNHEYESATPVVFISLDENYSAGMETAEVLREMQNPRFAVVVASSSRNVDEILDIIKTGNTLLHLPANQEEVMTNLRKAVQMNSHDDNKKDDGKAYFFAGTSGGAGTTTIACHVAVALANEGKKTLLVDHHISLGHVALYLDISNSGRSIYDLVSNQERLDDSLLGSYTVTHDSGLDVLCSPDAINSTVEPSADALKNALRYLRSKYNFIIFDSSASDTELPNLVAEAERIYFVASAEVASMRNLLRYAAYFGKNSSKYQIVVNHEGRSAITGEHIEERVGLVLAAAFKEQPTISAATNAGRVVDTEDREFYKSLNTLLDSMDPREVQEDQQQGKRWFLWGKR
jgi:pilus assembly protein CpaE